MLTLTSFLMYETNHILTLHDCFSEGTCLQPVIGSFKRVEAKRSQHGWGYMVVKAWE